MIIDDECDMCRCSACDRAGNGHGGDIGELSLMRARHASPLLFEAVP